jgi:hypothetical protein
MRNFLLQYSKILIIYENGRKSVTKRPAKGANLLKRVNFERGKEGLAIGV